MKTLSWESRLLEWFDTHQRWMPWRDLNTPYATWVSEMMLQQTQVVTVIPYFERFMKTFPTVYELAVADEQHVLKMWEGLGYYSRARHLHKAAKIVVSDYAGIIPDDYDSLLTLPGIGPYCAAAIASISFGVAIPVVDGNVLRVFTRFWGIFDDIRKTSVRDVLFHKLSAFIKHVNPSFFNQGIMECGALICTPKSPNCDQCPLALDCFAYQNNKITELPYKSKKPKVPHYSIGIGVVWKDNKVLIGKRRQDQMCAGLWEFPGGKQFSDETIETTVIREVKEETGLDIHVKQFCAVVKHAYSHFKVTLNVFHCDYVDGMLSANSCDELRWVCPHELIQYPVPTANKKIIPKVIDFVRS